MLELRWRHCGHPSGSLLQPATSSSRIRAIQHYFTRQALDNGTTLLTILRSSCQHFGLALPGLKLLF